MARRRTVALLLLLFLILGLLSAGATYGYMALVEPKYLGFEGSVVTIEPGQHLGEIAAELQRLGMVRSDFFLILYARYRGLEEALQAGSYHLSGWMSAVDVLEKIVSGDAVFNEITVTIPEGFTLAQIADRFETLGLFSRDEFEAAAVVGQEFRDLWVLNDLPDGKILEGYLFPDTYRIFPTSTPETVIRRMVQHLQRVIDGRILRDIEGTGATLHEILTLASIVQKESPEWDMPGIAGVFWNRLEIGQPLESDATVNYVLGTSNLQPTFRDTEVDHPYNTYRNRGLPPGPIGNPGLAAIDATVHPLEHDYYFFLHKPTLETVFSRTFGEHLAAKARYLD
ncbi:MAG: endolytic transglycosylase MltG [Spirochaetaceae bacterium]